MSPRADQLLPPGFRAVAALAYLLCALGGAQLVALAARQEAHPIVAAALALLLGGGGASLLFLMRHNAWQHRPPKTQPQHLRQRSAADMLTALALALIAIEAIRVWTAQWTFDVRPRD